MGVVDIPYKYLGLTPKTSKDIKKVNRVIFFSTSQYILAPYFSSNIVLLWCDNFAKLMDKREER